MSEPRANQIEHELSSIPERASRRESIGALLHALGERLGAAGLVLDRDGVALLDLDAGLTLTLVHVDGSPGVIVAIPVADAESLSTETLLQLLQANQDWELTAGGVLGIGPDGRSVLLSRSLLLAGRPIDRQEADLTDMVEAAIAWRDALAQDAAPGEEAAAEMSRRPGPPGIRV